MKDTSHIRQKLKKVKFVQLNDICPVSDRTKKNHNSEKLLIKLTRNLQKQQTDKERLQRKLVEKEQQLDESTKKSKGMQNSLDEMKKRLENPDFVKIYKAVIERFNNENGKNDMNTIIDVQNEFKQWEKYLLKFEKTLEDLDLDLIETIEDKAYSLIKEKKLMTFPIVFKDRKKNIETFKRLVQDIQEEIEKETFSENLPDNLLSISRVNIRNSSELDYFFLDSKGQEDIQSLIKQSMNAILLSLKKINKSKHNIRRLMAETFRIKDKIFQNAQFFDAYDMIEKLANNDLDSSLDDVVQKVDNYLQENYKIARSNEKLLIDFQKKLFSLIKKSIVELYNDLRRSAINFENAITQFDSHQEFFQQWKTVYTNLMDNILQYLDKQLNIKKIQCQPRDMFDEDHHEPFDIAEPDKNYETNMIKSIVKEGFLIEENGKSYIINPVSVIVVNND